MVNGFKISKGSTKLRPFSSNKCPDRGIHAKDFRIGVPTSYGCGRSGRQRIWQLHARFAERLRDPLYHAEEDAVGSYGGSRFVQIAVGRAAHRHHIHVDAHAFIFFQLVDWTGRVSVGRSQRDRRRQRIARADQCGLGSVNFRG